MRQRVAVIVLALLALSFGVCATGCALFRFGSFSREIPPVHLRLRFVLLAPFPQVANATNAELKRLGGAEREDVSAKEVRWTVKDNEGEGEDKLSLREDTNLLIADFTVHAAPRDQKNTPETQQTGARKRSRKIFKTIGSLPGVGQSVDRDGIVKDTQYRNGDFSDGGVPGESKIIDVTDAAAEPIADGGVPSVPDAGTKKTTPKRR